MAFSSELIEEINLLLQFELSSAQSGIKVHSDAAPSSVAAAARLFDKGLIDKVDGGYLTSLGRETAEHAQGALRILTSAVPA
jgi:uncharacterized protein (TIGR02647 family)|tara:strand:+ start:525 stop:770 length:246 start_codon:yes stop_codon:yes gene_type:complete